MDIWCVSKDELMLYSFLVRFFRVSPALLVWTLFIIWPTFILALKSVYVTMTIVIIIRSRCLCVVVASLNVAIVSSSCLSFSLIPHLFQLKENANLRSFSGFNSLTSLGAVGIMVHPSQAAKLYLLDQFKLNVVSIFLVNRETHGQQCKLEVRQNEMRSSHHQMAMWKLR